MKKLFAVLPAIALTCSVNANAGFFDSLNKVLNTTGAVLNTVSGTSTSTSPTQNGYGNVGHPQPTAAQLSQIESKLKSANATGNSAQALTEATPMLKNFISTVACSEEYGMENIGRYTTLDAAKNKYQFSGAMRWMQYHPKTTQCLTVTQIGNISMPALNALKLQIMFVSDVSGESETKNYLIMKQADGNWLVDKSGVYAQ